MHPTLELFWRAFHNRREVGACVGLVPQPYDSGGSRTDQGISKQGNRRVRALLIEMVWSWLRYQPDSVLTRWFFQRTQGVPLNRRARRIAIVAVARRLAIALWRYLKDGAIPEGAQLKSVIRKGVPTTSPRKARDPMYGRFEVNMPVGCPGYSRNLFLRWGVLPKRNSGATRNR
ncbi:hypothetical protein OKW41_004892 [Paraburkholderia sp. UCT70]